MRKIMSSSAKKFIKFNVHSLGIFVSGKMANAVHRIVGRKAEPDKHTRRIDALYSRHFWHLIRFRRISKLTVTDYLPNEGGCSKALMVMFTIGFCRAYGVKYRHTPFAAVAHSDRDQDQWDRDWEEFFNLGLGEEPIGSKRNEAFDLFQLCHFKTKDGDDLTAFLDPPLSQPRPAYYLEIESLPQPQLQAFYAANFVDLLKPLIPDFRSRFYSDKLRDKKSAFTVCLHIRRGDVRPTRADMWTDTAIFSRVLDEICEILDCTGIDYAIHIFSQGKREDFQELEKHGPQYFLDDDPLWTLRQLIEADVLLMSKSCYSYVAAILNDAINIHERSVWPPFEDWIVRDTDGKLDGAAFERQLRSRLLLA